MFSESFTGCLELNLTLVAKGNLYKHGQLTFQPKKLIYACMAVEALPDRLPEQDVTDHYRGEVRVQ